MHGAVSVRVVSGQAARGRPPPPRPPPPGQAAEGGRRGVAKKRRRGGVDPGRSLPSRVWERPAAHSPPRAPAVRRPVPPGTAPAPLSSSERAGRPIDRTRQATQAVSAIEKRGGGGARLGPPASHQAPARGPALPSAPLHRSTNAGRPNGSTPASDPARARLRLCKRSVRVGRGGPGGMPAPPGGVLRGERGKARSGPSAPRRA